MTDPRAFVMTGSRSGGSPQAQMAEIAAALSQVGIDTMLVDADRLDRQQADALFAGRNFDSYVIVAANNRFRTEAPVRIVSFMTDHPCYLLKEITGNDPAYVTMGWVDETHLDAMDALDIPSDSIFLPHAGPDPVATPRSMGERDIDVFFSGTLAEPIERAAWDAQHQGIPEVLADLIFAAAARLQCSLESAIEAFLAAGARCGIDVATAFSQAVFCAAVTEAMRIAEINRRHAVLAALPAMRISVATAELPTALRARGDIEWIPWTEDFAAIRTLIARAKIVLNSTAKFPGGSHERIWYGMAEGAVVLTDPSRFMAREFRDAESIFYLPVTPPTGADLAYLDDVVHDPQTLDAVAARAAVAYGEGHTWKRRIAAVVEALTR